MKFSIGKKLLFVSLCAALLVAPGCKSDSGSSGVSKSPEVTQTTQKRNVSINPGFSSLYEGSVSKSGKTLSIGNPGESEVSRQANADGYDEFIGTMTVTDTNGQNVTNSPFDVLVEVNPTDWSARMDQTLSLFPGRYTVVIDVTRENFRYQGTKEIVVNDGVDQSHDLAIQPVIADTTVAVGTVTRTRTVTFKYLADQLAQFTDPKIAVTLNSGSERLFTINKQSGETTTRLDLPEGENSVKLKFFDGSDQLGKSKPDQETIIVGNDPAETFTISLIPLEGSFKFNLAVNGGDVALTVNLPEEAIAEAAGVENLQVKASLIQGNLSKHHGETTAIGDSSSDYKANFQFTNVYYGNYTLRLEFVDKAEKVTLGSCETVVELDNSSDLLPCEGLELTRSTYATGDLLGSVHVTVKDQNLHAVAGAVIKIGDQTVATTGEDAFGGSSYAHFYQKPGTYKLTVFHESGQASRDITITSLQSGLNLIIKLDKPVTAQPLNRLALGRFHSCFTKEDGTVRCWGYGQYGQIGNGRSDEYNTVPQQVIGLNNPIMLSAKGHTTCALTADRIVLCWGSDDHGQLGNDSVAQNQNRPVEIARLSGVQSIVTGSSHGCALMEDRTVQCWGYNNATYQPLGVNSSTGDLLTPQKVVGLQNVETLTAGIHSTCATLTDGAVRCWGYNSNGNLGIGNTTHQSSPQLVSILSDAVEVKLGYHHGFARFGNGLLKSWGWNNYHELGHGNGNLITTPQSALSALKGVVKQLALGYGHSCALLENSTAQCWGRQELGSLGNGTLSVRKASPVSVKSDDGTFLTGIRELVAGQHHNCAWLGGDRVKCWGYNYWGQVGDETTNQTNNNDYNRGFATEVKGL